MLPSFLITFREGLEAFLIVGIALAYLTKLNARHFHKYIYIGVFVGLILSLVIAVIFQIVIDQFSSELYQNYLMAGILIFATIVLTYMAIWMQKQAKNQVSELQENLTNLVSTGNMLGLVFLAVLAVLREGFETILFFNALMYAGLADFTTESAVIGGLLGLVLSVVVVYMLLKGTRKVPLREFFRWTSLLIIIIAAGLLSSAMNMLQAAHLIPIFYPEVFDISHILDDRGVFGTFLRALFGYNSSPGALQLTTWLVYISSAIYLWNKSYQLPTKQKQINSTEQAV